MPRLQRSIAIAALFFALGANSGCLTYNLNGYANFRGRPRFDDLVSLDAAWKSESQLVVAFTGYVSRSPDLRSDYAPPLFGSPEPWWFVVDLATPRAFDFGRDWPVWSSGPPRPPEGYVAPRETLRPGTPPPEAIHGLEPLPIIDTTWSKLKVRKLAFREEAAKPGAKLILFARSEERHHLRYQALVLHYVRPATGGGPNEVIRVALQPEIPPPRTWARVFVPLTLAIDIVVSAPIVIVYAAIFVPPYLFDRLFLEPWREPEKVTPLRHEKRGGPTEELEEEHPASSPPPEEGRPR